MTNRHRGDYFEHQTRDALEACGWVVIRAAGSLGPADIVGLRQGHRPLFVSCKLNGRIDPHERIVVVGAAAKAGARALVAMRSAPGWVELRSITLPPQRGYVVVDTLKVPTRRRP